MVPKLHCKNTCQVDLKPPTVHEIVNEMFREMLQQAYSAILACVTSHKQHMKTETYENWWNMEDPYYSEGDPLLSHKNQESPRERKGKENSTNPDINQYL